MNENKWEKVEENGQTFWVHEDHGNIFKQSDTSYVAMAPKVIKMGPFPSPELAQKALEECKQKLNQALDLFNEEVLEKYSK